MLNLEVLIERSIYYKNICGYYIIKQRFNKLEWKTIE